MTTILVQRMDGTTYDLDALDIMVEQFEPPSISYTHTSVQVGTYGERHISTTYGKRVIPFKCDVMANSYYDIRLQRKKLFDIFDSQEAFYVIDTKMPFMRWKVRAEQQPFGFYGNYYLGGDVSFNLNCEDGFAETVSSSIDMDNDNVAALLGFGMNLPADKVITYKFNSNTFSVLNPSVIPLTAEENPVNFVYKGASNGLTITNKTTNQSFKYNGSTSGNDELILSGAWPFLNNDGIFKDSDHGMIDLAKGWNDFELSGTQGSFEFEVDTHFKF